MKEKNILSINLYVEKKLKIRFKKDRIYSLADKEEFLLSVTENGSGKRSSSYEYRKTKRGGQAP